MVLFWFDLVIWYVVFFFGFGVFLINGQPPNLLMLKPGGQIVASDFSH